jgi:hypothetical protein
MAVVLGYKFLDMKREDGDSTIKTQLRGPFVAAGFSF